MKKWAEFLSKLEETLGKETIQKWIKPLKVLKFDAYNLHLDAQNSFQILWFDEHVKHYFLKEFLNSRGQPFKLHFSIEGSSVSPEKRKKVTLETKQYFSPDHLASHATLSNFHCSDSPYLAYDILSEFASTLSPTYSPIFLYGSSGSGKTHLLMGVAHALQKAGKKVFYVRSETFTEHVIRAFRTSSLQEFRPAYRDLDCLIIDDVQGFRRKNTTQEELFHTFNRLHTQGIPILLSANQAPQFLEGIEDRLKSRFEWGITLPLIDPSLETKRKVLKKRGELLSLPLTEILAAYLLETFPTLPRAIRALEALALRLHHTNPVTLDIPYVEKILKDLIENEQQEKLTPEKIVLGVSNHFQMRSEDILGRSQNKECVFPRKVAMYLCRAKLKMSYPQIGRFFARDHSTVMTSVKTIEKNIKAKDREILYSLETILKSLKKKG